MATFSLRQVKMKANEVEHLRINHSQGIIQSKVRVFQYRDKDTRQIVIYIPSLDLTGYGASQDKAEEMVKFSMKEFFSHVLTLNVKKANALLTNLGWKHNPVKNKEYSKAYIDEDGNLKNLNAVNDEVEERVLVTT